MKRETKSKIREREVSKDVRYQEFTEVTLGRKKACKERRGQGSLHFFGSSRRKRFFTERKRPRRKRANPRFPCGRVFFLSFLSVFDSLFKPLEGGKERLARNGNVQTDEALALLAEPRAEGGNDSRFFAEELFELLFAKPER